MANHHIAGPECPLCEEKKKDLCADLQTWWDWVKTHYPEEHLAWTFRDKVSQDQLYLDGKTKAKWPNSKHNILWQGKPCAEAWDSFKLRPDGVAEFRPTRYETIWEDLSRAGAPISWAGNWEDFKEFDHFQLVHFSGAA